MNPFVMLGQRRRFIRCRAFGTPTSRPHMHTAESDGGDEFGARALLHRAQSIFANYSYSGGMNPSSCIDQTICLRLGKETPAFSSLLHHLGRGANKQLERHLQCILVHATDENRPLSHGNIHVSQMCPFPITTVKEGVGSSIAMEIPCLQRCSRSGPLTGGLPIPRFNRGYSCLGLFSHDV